MTAALPTAMHGVREWIPECHTWRVLIRGRWHSTPSTAFVRHVFDLDLDQPIDDDQLEFTWSPPD